MKKTIIYTFRGLGILMTLFVFAGWLSTFFPTTPADLGYAATPTSFVVDPRLVALGARIGLTESQLAEVHAQIADCDGEANGCYLAGTDTILIVPRMLENRTVARTLAHEWYHHYFEKKLNAEGRKVVGDSLMVIYNSSTSVGEGIRWRMQPYVKKGLVPGTEDFNNELHSVWCTEVADNRMTPSSLQYCAKIIPGRNALENTIY